MLAIRILLVNHVDELGYHRDGLPHWFEALGNGIATVSGSIDAQNIVARIIEVCWDPEAEINVRSLE